MHASSQRTPNGNIASKPDVATAYYHMKYKKSEKTGLVADSSKGERPVKWETVISNGVQHADVRTEDFSDFVRKEGGLSQVSTIETLVCAMRQDHSNMLSADMASKRIAFATTIASTGNGDWLAHFIQLGGLVVLDDWLQEAHKGRAGNGGEERNGSEELILMLLQALEKLPIDLDALKTCPVGKSVNNLRTHSSWKVQKKARKLVEVWKKRVDDEIKFLDEAKLEHGTNVNWSVKHAQSQPAKAQTETCTKGTSSYGKLKRTVSNERVADVSLAEKETPVTAQDEISNHQKLILRLPNPARSPSSRGGASSRASSLSSVDKHDESAKIAAYSPNTCGETKITSPNSNNHVDCGPSGIKEKPTSPNPLNFFSGNIADTNVVDVKLEEGADAKGVTDVASSASVTDSGGSETDNNRSQADAESESGKGDIEAVHDLKRDGAVKIEAATHIMHSSSQGQLMDEEPKPSLDRGSQQGFTASASRFDGCCTAKLAGAASDSGMSRRSIDDCMMASSVECQATLDDGAPDSKKGSDDGTKSASRIQSFSAKVNVESRGLTSGYDTDALAVARNISIEGEQVPHGTLDIDACSLCTSETDFTSKVSEKVSEEETGVIGIKLLDCAWENEEVDLHESVGARDAMLSHPIGSVVCMAALQSLLEAEVVGDVSVPGNDCFRRSIFDLNEGLNMEKEPIHESATNHTMGEAEKQPVIFSSPIATPVAVVTATKGPFILRSGLLRSPELGGWKGSAATSAFRPAEPRQCHLAEKSRSLSNGRGKRARLLDIDLNVPGEKGTETLDMLTSTTMDLDLNKTDETKEIVRPLRPDSSKVSVSSLHTLRDFDLNDGCEDEGCLEQRLSMCKQVVCPVLPQHTINPMVVLNSSIKLQANGSEPLLPLEAFPMVKPSNQHSGVCAMQKSDLPLFSNFPSTSSVHHGAPYAGFPYGPVPSSSVVARPISARPSHLASASTATVNHCAMPYFVSSELPACSAGSYWARPGLDLNAGVMDAREDGSGSLHVEVEGGPLERKEPEPYSGRFRSSCWQWT